MQAFIKKGPAGGLARRAEELITRLQTRGIETAGLLAHIIHHFKLRRTQYPKESPSIETAAQFFTGVSVPGLRRLYVSLRRA